MEETNKITHFNFKLNIAPHPDIQVLQNQIEVSHVILSAIVNISMKIDNKEGMLDQDWIFSFLHEVPLRMKTWRLYYKWVPSYR